MNENITPDDLPERLDALGERLRRPPRADARVEALLGAAPPHSGAVDGDPAEVTPFPLVAPAPKRRTAWIAVAAALALLAGVGAAAYAIAGDDPAQPALAAAGDTDAVEPAPEDTAPEDTAPEDTAPEDTAPDGDEPPGDLADSLEEHHAWLECVTGRLSSLFEDGFPSGQGDFGELDECGEPPSIDGLLSDGFGFCVSPDTGDETGRGCATDGTGWFPFDDLPGLENLPDVWSLPGLGDWRSLDDVCSSDSTETGVDIVCEWPVCDNEDDCPFPPDCALDVEESAPCLGFDFGFGLEFDPEGFGFSVPFGGEGHFFIDPEMLPDTLPDLPDDFEFPRDLPELDAWLEEFPWADEFDALFGDLEPTDA